MDRSMATWMDEYLLETRCSWVHACVDRTVTFFRHTLRGRDVTFLA